VNEQDRLLLTAAIEMLSQQSKAIQRLADSVMALVMAMAEDELIDQPVVPEYLDGSTL
jgi:hypothetical protein